MKYRLIFVLSVLCPISAFASESPFSYNFVSAGYSSGSVTVSGTSLDTSGTGLGASIATSDSTFIRGSFGNGSLKVGTATVALDDWSLGFGGRMPLASTTDLVGSLSYVSSTLSYNGAWITSTGYSFDGGLRHALGDKAELAGGVGVAITGSDQIQTTSVNVGARFKVSDGFSLGVGYARSRNTSATSSGFGVNGRVEF